jgi:hypothetical protein
VIQLQANAEAAAQVFFQFDGANVGLAGFSGVSASALLAGLLPGAGARSRRGELERLFRDKH